MSRPSAGTVWLGFAAISTAAAMGIAVAGNLAAGKTAWIAGDGSVPAACLASLIGSWAGALPLARALGERAADPRRPGLPAAAIGKASLFRLLGTVLAGGGLAIFGDWQRRSLLLTVAVSYLLLLAVETGWLMQRLRATNAQTLNGKIGDGRDGA